MSLSIVVNGGGTFTASMEEGPVSFTASLAAVGPKGDTGATGATGPGVAVGGTTGQVLAKASATNYDTEWVARNPFNQSLNTTDTVSFQNINAGVGDFSDISIGGSINYLGGSITFADSTTQSTALPSGTDDGYIIEWNADTSTYASVPNDARTLFITARNNTGTTIPKGSVVLITGASGNRPTIGLAQGDTSANADGVIGITAAAINNNANGRVITEGLASNLDTDAFAAGDKLYLSAVTPGGLVNVRPVQPAHSVAVGVVTRSNPAVGSIEVRVQVGEHLEFLHDVLLTSNTNLDLLSYETSSGLWKNKSFSTLGLLTSAAAASTYLTISTAASTYAPLASPTFTGTVTIPAGASISGFALLASPVFTGVPEAPTAAATTNTTQVATTAFVQQEVPAASTTAAGKVELATDAEAVAGTSATLAVTPSSNLFSQLSPAIYRPRADSYTQVVSGGSTAVSGVNLYLNTAAVTSGNYAIRRYTDTLVAYSIGQRINRVDWSKPIWLSCRVITSVASPLDANARCRLTFGKATGDNAGDLTRIGFGFTVAGGGNFQAAGHDGSNLTNGTNGTEAIANTAKDVVIYSDGTGNVTLYVNGVNAGSCTGGPSSGTSDSPVFQFEVNNDSTATAASVVAACNLALRL